MTGRQRRATSARHRGSDGPSASPAGILTSDNLRLSEPRNGVGGVAEQEFQTSESELVQATSDVAALVELGELEDQARRLARGSRSDSTWRAYDSDLRRFQAWCSEHHLNALPAEPLTVATYLAALASTRSPSNPEATRSDQCEPSADRYGHPDSRRRREVCMGRHST